MHPIFKYSSVVAAFAVSLTLSAQSVSSSANAAGQAGANVSHAATQTNAAGQGAANVSRSAAQTNAAGQAGANLSRSAAQTNAAEASNVGAQLTQKIDSKNAHVGDQVMAKTTSAATLSDGTKLPKNTKLVGQITDVHAKSKADNTSHLAFAFDRAILNSGQQVPIRAMLMSLSAPAAATSASGGDDFMTPIGGGSMNGGGMVSGGGGGGLLGGATHATGGLVGGTAGMAGSTASNIGAATGNVARSTSAMTSSTTNAAGSVGSIGSAGGGLSTGNVMQVDRAPVGNLPGVTFSSMANGSSSGSLDASGRDINLSNGTQMNFAVSAAQQ